PSLIRRATASSALQPLELEQETPWRQSRSQCWRDSLIAHCVTPFLLIQLYRKVSFRFLQMCRPRQIEKQRTINQRNLMQTTQADSRSEPVAQKGKFA